MKHKPHEDHVHLHPEAQLYAHHATALLEHAEASKNNAVQVVENDEKDVEIGEGQ